MFSGVDSETPVADEDYTPPPPPVDIDALQPFAYLDPPELAPASAPEFAPATAPASAFAPIATPSTETSSEVLVTPAPLPAVGAPIPAPSTSYVDEATPVVDPNAAPPGYQFLVWEHEDALFKDPTDVAYGGNGQFVYKSGVVGSIRFDNDTFTDPLPGTYKAGFFKVPTSPWPWIIGGGVLLYFLAGRRRRRRAR